MANSILVFCIVHLVHNPLSSGTVLHLYMTHTKCMIEEDGSTSTEMVDVIHISEFTV